MSDQSLFMFAEREVSLIYLLTKRWKLNVLIIASCIGLAGFITGFLPKHYESRMRFLINNERADLVITPEKNQMSSPPNEITEAQVNSEMELVKSRDILEAVILDQGLFLEAPPNRSGAPSKLEMAHAINKLERNLGVEAIRKTNIIEVFFASTDPDKTVSVLNDLGSRYLNAHLAAHSTPGTYNFFTEKVNQYREQLLQVRLAISDFHQKRQLYSMPEQQSSVLDAYQSIDNRLKATEAEIEKQKVRLGEAEHQLATFPERIMTQLRVVPNQLAIEQLQTTLTSLSNKRIELATKFKSGDKLLNEVDNQIAATNHDLETVKNMSSEERTTDVDTVRQTIKADYVRTKIEYQGLEGQRAELLRIRSGYLNQLNTMDKDFVMLQQLEEKKKDAQDNYDLYIHRLDEARLAESLDREKFVNVTMIEKPISSPIPISPRLPVNLAAGAMFGTFICLALAFFANSKPNKTLPDEVEVSPTGAVFPSRAFQTASGD